MSKVHTGDTEKIRNWFEANPDEEFTSADMCVLFDLKRWQVNNAITQLTKKNVVIKTGMRNEGKAHMGTYRLRKESEKREEFKVAKVAAVRHNKPKTPDKNYPVWTEMDPAKVSQPIKRLVNQAFSTAAQNGRIQFLNPTTIIVWNSSRQFEEMRRVALCE